LVTRNFYGENFGRSCGISCGITLWKQESYVVGFKKEGRTALDLTWSCLDPTSVEWKENLFISAVHTYQLFTDNTLTTFLNPQLLVCVSWSCWTRIIFGNNEKLYCGSSSEASSPSFSYCSTCRQHASNTILIFLLFNLISARLTSIENKIHIRRK
jgi:hypothetical protein